MKGPPIKSRTLFNLWRLERGYSSFYLGRMLKVAPPSVRRWDRLGHMRPKIAWKIRLLWPDAPVRPDGLMPLVPPSPSSPS